MTAASSTARDGCGQRKLGTSTRLDSTSLLHSLRAQVGEDEREMRGSFRVGTVALPSIPKSCHGHREHIPRANANPATLSLPHTFIASSSKASLILDSCVSTSRRIKLPSRCSRAAADPFPIPQRKSVAESTPIRALCCPSPPPLLLSPSSARPADRSPTNRPRQGSSAQPAIPPPPPAAQPIDRQAHKQKGLLNASARD